MSTELGVTMLSAAYVHAMLEVHLSPGVMWHQNIDVFASDACIAMALSPATRVSFELLVDAARRAVDASDSEVMALNARGAENERAMRDLLHDGAIDAVDKLREDRRELVEQAALAWQTPEALKRLGEIHAAAHLRAQYRREAATCDTTTPEGAAEYMRRSAWAACEQANVNRLLREAQD